MKNKIIAVVRFNKGEGFVMKKPVQYKYTKCNGNLIIGIDRPFVCCYYYDRPILPINKCWSGWQAFGGRKFDLPLIDGTTEHCWGQWWFGGADKAEKILKTKLISVIYKDIARLKECYVFVGQFGIKKEIEKLREKYKGKVYDYWEYERIIKNKEN